MSTKRRTNESAGRDRGPLLRLQRELCRGCTHCIRVCPTEAIRVRKGKAEVVLHRCIHCGECIRVCPWEAWATQSDSLNQTRGRERNSWALLDPAVFGQFGNLTSPSEIIEAFDDIGFSSVRVMKEGLEIYGEAVSDFLSSEEVVLPAISSDCPAVVQLVQVRFPSLIENLVPIIPPYEIMASRLKKETLQNSTVNLHYIVPCLAKAQAAIAPLSSEGGFTGAIPLADLYNLIKDALHKKIKTHHSAASEQEYALGLEWPFPGRESQALGVEASLCVDGIQHVADILELAENGLLGEVPFIEAWSCPGGCLGGSLNVKNPFWARFHLESWVRKHPSSSHRSASRVDSSEKDRPSRSLAPRQGMRLDEDLNVAMEKLRRIDEVIKKLPGIDCGSCGCPNCLALAEDIVQGFASEKDCIYVWERTKGNRSKGKERV